MPGLFENTVSAICYEVAREQATDLAPFDLPPYNEVTEFVLDQWRRMPRFLALPLRAVTVFFAVSALASGALFHRLPPQRREIRMKSWRTSSFGPCRDLMRFYRSLALMALYSRGLP